MEDGITKQIDLSIIIPHYNSPLLLNKLLSTIPNEENIQTIVVDDKSDKELELFEGCKKQNLSVLFLSNGSSVKGAGKSRNIALEHAKGKWVLFADADDVFLEGWFDKVKLYFLSESDIIFFNPISKKADGSISDRHIEFSNYVENYVKHQSKKSDKGQEKRKVELDLLYRFTPPWSKLIRLELIKNNAISFDEIIYSNDVMFSIKTSYFAKKIEVTEEQIYCLMERSGSLSSVGSDYSTEERTKVLITRYLFLKERLSRNDMKLLDLSALGRIVMTFRNPNASNKTKRNVIAMCMKAHMPLMPRKVLSRKFWNNRLKR
ncbi:MAG: glycosyltransferase [Lachnospiraceae bacterium]